MGSLTVGKRKKKGVMVDTCERNPITAYKQRQNQDFNFLGFGF